MKKLLKYTIVLFLLCGPSGCESFLDQSDPDAFEIDKYYKTEQDMEDALIAAYQAMRPFYNKMYYATEMKSDNTSTTNMGDSGGIYATFVTHLVYSSNSIVADIWNGLYLCIYRANLVLKYIDRVPMSDESRERISAEAKFLRALSHFYLIQLYGPVPVMDRIVETVQEAKQKTRQSIEEAYTLIISDLTTVAECESLNTFEADARMGHATRTAGAALLGKVYVTMAATLKNETYYDDAIEYLSMACDLNNMHELPTSFPNVFGVNNESCTEIIFQCMYLGNATEKSSFAYDFQPYGLKELLSHTSGRGCNLGEKNLFNEFESGDRRKPTSIVQVVGGADYYTKKYVDLSNTSGYGGNNWIELRFADVFLLMAEAYEQLGDNTNAVKYLDLVRTKHGGLKGYEETRQTKPEYAAAYPTLRDAIFHERRMELSFENHRWFDLQRLYPDGKDLETYMKSVDTDHKYSGFKEYEKYLPIPYDEVLFNKNIYQNPGY